MMRILKYRQGGRSQASSWNCRSGGAAAMENALDGTIGQTKEADMIVVRDIFQLKFGQAGQAIELWKQVMEINRKLGYGGTSRMLTDLVGSPYYTLGLGTTYGSMGRMG